MKNYITWGADQIEQGAKTQMDNAMALPVAVSGALMPDAHQGYGLPIGGVLALDNAVCPYAVGVDIACQMKLSILHFYPEDLVLHHDQLCKILREQTFFGVGVENNRNDVHKVLEADWGVSPITKENQAKARRKLGTSGSGNHFVEFGILTISNVSDPILDLSWGADKRTGGLIVGDCLFPAKQQFVAPMSHSGSRGTGAAVCNHYTKLAKAERPEYGDLAWLELGTPAGDEYWAAMNLMGDYASANHDVIHREIARELGVKTLHSIENHHNFAWKETHAGREVIVHRKGATPAGVGVMGVIPGSMGTPAYTVRGRGSPDSLCSASHGAGRLMSRTQAKKTFVYRDEIAKLKERGITVLSAGADEVCGVYKDIDQVMAAQSDLVEVVARFDPKIVKMCGSKDRAED